MKRSPAKLGLAGVLALLASGQAFAQEAQDSTLSFTYDEMGNVRTTTNAINTVVSTEYDALYRPNKVSEVAPSGTVQSTRFGYDGLDQLKSVTDPRSLVTTYAVDGLANRSALQSPDTNGTTYEYDAAGNLTASKDARGKATRYTYDALNRITSVRFESGEPVTYEYDGGASGTPDDIGHLTRMTDESGSTGFSYDPMGRLLSKTQSVTLPDGSAAVLALKYEYGTSGSATGKVTSMTYPSGNRINYGYDEAGRINRMTLNPRLTSRGDTNTLTEVVLLSDITYTPFGAVQSWKWGNHSEASPNVYNRTFDLDGRITSYPLGNPNVDGVLRTVAYDAAGRITGYTHTGAGTATANYDQSFGYDAFGRLTSFTMNGQTTTYSYDANGNRTAQTGPFGSYAISSSSNQMLAANVGTAKQYTYDAAGNMVSDGMRTFTYSDRGRMASVVGPTGSAQYRYNAVGQRVAKFTDGAATLYVYDSEGRTLVESGGSIPVEETVYLGNFPVVVLPAAERSPPRGRPHPHGRYRAPYYIYTDHLWAPRVLTNIGTNEIDWSWIKSDPFGTLSPVSEIMTYNHRLPGQMYDLESGTFYNYFRDYAPYIGRYLQSDPIGLLGGTNTYSYVGANPVRSIDPLGLQCIYEQSTGLFVCTNDKSGTVYFRGRGYAGTGEGRNNSSAQDKQGVGPLPRGNWTVGKTYDSPKTGINTIILIPGADNECFGTGRDCNSFRIHGDNAKNDASEGCIILPPKRKKIPNGEIITVISGDD